MFAKRSREPGTRGARVAAQEIDGEKGGKRGPAGQDLGCLDREGKENTPSKAGMGHKESKKVQPIKNRFRMGP